MAGYCRILSTKRFISETSENLTQNSIALVNLSQLNELMNFHNPIKFFYKIHIRTLF